MLISSDFIRLISASGVVLAYLGLCAVALKPLWRKPGAAEANEHWVCYASQTGGAERLAEATAAALNATGRSTRLLPLMQIDADELAACKSAYFIVSTTGNGDAPDNGAAFVRRFMDRSLALPQLRYAVLALGSRRYRDFCGFGRQLDDWLGTQGARRHFSRIDVSDHDPAAIAQWYTTLGTHVSSAPPTPAAGDWINGTLATRRHLNPGSAGEPVFLVELKASVSSWQAGDTVELRHPGGDPVPRTYTLASLPEERSLALLVRQQRHPDGSLGLMSGWLTEGAALGETVKIRVCAQENFRLGDNTMRPMILIGNGTGLSGLFSHLKARAADGLGANWLIFGERNALYDFHLKDELQALQAAGALAQLDAVFSRDGDEHRYVQHRLVACADEIRLWIADGAAIYVCGSRHGMASGVDEALADILGRDVLDTLGSAGRYRRDVY